MVKLPKLYEHYREHQALNPEVSLYDYLAMHYWGQDLNDDDDEKDMQLPFKKHDISTPSFLFIPNNKVVCLKPQAWPVEEDFDAERSTFYFNPAGESLFRPPRV